MTPEELLEAVAHHEAAHIVIAAVHGLVLAKDGIYIERRGGGIALNRDYAPGGVFTDRERKAVILVCYAGKHAHVKQCDSEIGCWDCDDVVKARKQAEAMYPNNFDDLDNCLSKGREESKRLVERYWPEIDAVAKALIDGEWKDEAVEKYGLQNPVKHLEGLGVKAVLQNFNIDACVEE